MAKNDTVGWIIAIAAIALVILAAGYNPMAAVKKDIPPEETDKGCYSTDKTVVTYVVDDAYNAGTSHTPAADNEVRVFVDGVAKDGAYVSTGDSFTVNPLSNVDLYYVDVGQDNAMTSANTFKHSFKAPCAGTHDLSLNAVDAVTGGASGTTTIGVLFMDDVYKDVTGDQSTNTWAIAAGNVETGTFKISGVVEDGFGATGGEVCMVLTSNKTEFKSITLTSDELTKKSCRPDGAVSSLTDEQYDEYVFPSIEGVQIIDGSITVELKSDAIGVASATYLNMTLFDPQYFLDADDGKIKLGYEDEDDNLLGIAEITEYILFS